QGGGGGPAGAGHLLWPPAARACTRRHRGGQPGRPPHGHLRGRAAARRAPGSLAGALARALPGADDPCAARVGRAAGRGGAGEGRAGPLPGLPGRAARLGRAVPSRVQCRPHARLHPGQGARAGGGRLRRPRAVAAGRRGAAGAPGAAPLRASFTQPGALSRRTARTDPGNIMEYNKVNAGSGAQWLLDGIALLRRHPATLLVIGLGDGVLASIPVVSVLVGALGVVLMGGVLLAVRHADQNQPTNVAMLFAGFTSGKVGRLLVLLLIGVVFMLVVSLLLVMMLGGDGIALMQRILESTPAGGQPDPALIAQLPAARRLGWFARMVLLAGVVGIYTCFYMALVMYTDLGAGQALRASMKAGARNLPALLVYMLVSVVFSVVVMLASLLVSTLLGLVVGAQWAAVVSGVLVTMVVVPVAGGAMYYGWRQVFADRLPGTPPALPEDTGSGFHA